MNGCVIHLMLKLIIALDLKRGVLQQIDFCSTPLFENLLREIVILISLLTLGRSSREGQEDLENVKC